MKSILLLIFAVILVFKPPGPHGAGNAIDEVNENMNVPFPLTLPEKDLENGSEYTKIPGFGCYALYKEGLWFSVSGWPDVIDDYHVTEYRFTNPEYRVFGISVGDTLDTAASILGEHGYRLRESDSHIYSKNNKVAINLCYDENDENKAIYEIWVTAVATNKHRIVF